MGFFDKLKQGLEKTKQIFSFTKVDENLLDELEEKLIMADVGMQTTEKIISELRTKIKKISDGKEYIETIYGGGYRLLPEGKPAK